MHHGVLAERDLAEQLRRRLRLIAALWALANLCLTGIGLALEARFGYGGLTRRPRVPEYIASATFYFRIDLDGRITAYDRDPKAK